MVDQVTATLMVGMPDVLYPRYWLGTTATMKAVFDATVTPTGIVFQGVRPDSSPVQVAAEFHADTGEWLAEVYLDQVGTWVFRADCGAPQKQGDEQTFEVVASRVVPLPPWPMQLAFSDPRNSGLLFIL